jgi:hypothetical protein
MNQDPQPTDPSAPAAGPAAPPAGWRRESGAMPTRRVVALVLAALGILALVLAGVRWGAERRRGAGDAGEEAALSGAPTRAYTLYFVDGGKLVGERREIVAKPTQAAQVSAVISEMLSGSLTGHDSAVPEGTVLLHLFIGDSGLVTLDLSRDVLRRQPGSLEAEYATLAALVRSVKENFPEVHSVQILIDGKPEPTLAGHFSIDEPLLCEDWLADPRGGGEQGGKR